LALANISGSMMIQATVPSAFGLFFTAWLFDGALGAVPDLLTSQREFVAMKSITSMSDHACRVEKLPGSPDCDQRWQCADMN